MISKTFFNRAPLPHNHLTRLPAGAIRPAGWLKEQMRTMSDGFVGHLYENWAPADSRCAWLGGGGDKSFLAPLYLNSLLPLGYMLDDGRLMQAAQAYLDSALSSQRENGDFGPEGADAYAKALICAAAREMFLTGGDRKYLVFLDRYLRFHAADLMEHPLNGIASARAALGMENALWLYNLTGQNYLLQLCGTLREQSYDWANHFHIFPTISPTRRLHPWQVLRSAMAQETPPAAGGLGLKERAYYTTSGADVAWGLGQPGIVNLFKSGFKELGGFRNGWSKLMRYHGTAMGMFTCDGSLAGNSPMRGTDLAAACGVIHSIASLLPAGDEFGSDLPDIMEKIAFNVLPAAFDGDMRCRAALQKANQVEALRTNGGFYNFPAGSCTFDNGKGSDESLAAAGLGFTDYVRSLWMATDDGGLCCLSCAPSEVLFRAGGEPVHISVETSYPFRGTAAVKVNPKSPCEFPLYLRLPVWAKSVMVRLPDGEILQMQGGETACVRKVFAPGDTVQVDFSMTPHLSRWTHHSASVELGALVMCLRPEEIREGSEVTARQNICYALKDEQMKVIHPEGEPSPFKGKDQVQVLAKAARTLHWDARTESLPISPDVGEEEVITLTPYGNSALRIAQFPMTDEA